MKVEIRNQGYDVDGAALGHTSVIRELTEEQYEWLRNLFDELDDQVGLSEPCIMMFKI